LTAEVAGLARLGSVVAVAGSAVDAVVVKDIDDGSMCLPNADRALVEERKLRDYLLSPSHPVGRFKAALFAQLGYSQEDWSKTCASNTWYVLRDGSGKRDTYRIAAPLTGPTGRRVPCPFGSCVGERSVPAS